MMHEKTYGCKPVNVNIRKDVKRCKMGKHWIYNAGDL